MAAPQVVRAHRADCLLRIPHAFFVEVFLKLFVQTFKEDVIYLFFSWVGNLAEGVLEFGDVVVWVLRLLFDGVKPSSVSDVGATECVYSEPVPFELIPVRWVTQCVEVSCRGVFQVLAYAT